jgi:hypothetical protein
VLSRFLLIIPILSCCSYMATIPETEWVDFMRCCAIIQMAWFISSVYGTLPAVAVPAARTYFDDAYNLI